jgi:hypothetical protein
MGRRKIFLIGIGVVVALAALCIALFAASNAQRPASGAEPLSYRSADLGIAFTYPAHYELSEESATGGHVVVLGDKDALAAARAREASEGPPTINIAVLANPKNLSLADWVAQAIEANSGPAGDKPVATTLSGQAALKYRLTGLYESDAIALMRGGKVYVFSVAWLAPSDPLVKDFEEIINSVTFI